MSQRPLELKLARFDNPVDGAFVAPFSLSHYILLRLALHWSRPSSVATYISSCIMLLCNKKDWEIVRMRRKTNKVHGKRVRAKLRGKIRRNYIASNDDDASPFVHGMARVIDVAGLLRTTNVHAARKVQRRHLQALKQPNSKILKSPKVMGEVGAYFHRVI